MHERGAQQTQSQDAVVRGPRQRLCLRVGPVTFRCCQKADAFGPLPRMSSREKQEFFKD